MDLINFFEDAWWYKQSWTWKIAPHQTLFKKELHVVVYKDFFCFNKPASTLYKYDIHHKVMYIPFSYKDNKLMLFNA